MQIIIDIEYTDLDPDELLEQVEEVLEGLFEHEGISAQIYIGSED